MLNKKSLKKITATVLMLPLCAYSVHASEPFQVFMPMSTPIPMPTPRPIYVSRNGISETDNNPGRPSPELIQRITEHRDYLIRFRNQIESDGVNIHNIENVDDLLNVYDRVITVFFRDLFNDFLDLFVLHTIAGNSDNSDLSVIANEVENNGIHMAWIRSSGECFSVLESIKKLRAELKSFEDSKAFFVIAVYIHYKMIDYFQDFIENDYKDFVQNLINFINMYLGIYDHIQGLISSGQTLKPTREDLFNGGAIKIDYEELVG